ncbi:hypothetical protein J7M28_00220 [bacterium]|nr:hypothetical protein [bacterium]
MIALPSNMGKSESQNAGAAEAQADLAAPEEIARAITNYLVNEEPVDSPESDSDTSELSSREEDNRKGQPR